MKTRFALAPLIISALASFASAGEDDQPKRVLELFTSQGCSSCPPANQFAGAMTANAETLVLSYGVTYWDYLGWKDTFAKPEFTKRQKAYGSAFDSTNVYTPQMIINGSAHSPVYAPDDVISMDLPESNLTLNLMIRDGTFEISGQPTQNVKNYSAVLVEYVPGPQSVPVENGENRGRVLTLSNVVTDVFSLGKWSGADTLGTEVKPNTGKAYAVLVHDPDTLKLVTVATYQADTPTKK